MPLNNNNSLLKFTLIGLTLSLSGLLACMLFTSNTAFAQQQLLQNPNPAQNTAANASNTLSLTGTATTMVKPDKVTVSLGVQTTNKTADTALATNSKTMNQVIDALKETGIKDNETSTSSFSISPNYNYSQPSSSSSSTANRITGFTVSNSIQIQSTNVNDTSKWIDAAIAAGANTVDRIDFALSDKKLEETKNSLIKQAMQDARAKSDIVASVAGMKVVGIRSISLDLAIQGPFPPAPIPLAKQSLATAEQARPTPVISGQEQVSTNIAVVFLIQ